MGSSLHLFGWEVPPKKAYSFDSLVHLCLVVDMDVLKIIKDAKVISNI